MRRLIEKKELTNLFTLVIGFVFFVTAFAPVDVLASSKPLTELKGASPGTSFSHGDPIYMGGGEFREYWQLLDLGGLMPIDFNLVYAPDLEFKSPVNDSREQFPPWAFIAAFNSNTVIRMVEYEDQNVSPGVGGINVFIFDDYIVFKDDGSGSFIPVGPRKYQIQKIGDYYYMMDPVRGWVYIFRSREYGSNWGPYFIRRVGEVVYIIDRNANSLSYSYNQDSLPTRVEDGLGRSLDLTYIDSIRNTERHLQSVTDGRGRTVTFNYQQLTCSGEVQDVLASFTDAMGQTTSFDFYTTENTLCNLIRKINRPLGNSHIDQTWTENPKGFVAVESQKDVYGNEVSLNYSEDAGGDIVIAGDNPDGTRKTFEHTRERYPKEVTDETGNQFNMDYNSDDQMTSVTDRLGDSTSMIYHSESGKIGSLTNAKGDTIIYSYTSQDQTFANPADGDAATFTFYSRSRIDYPDGTNEQFTYDARGNVLTRQDFAGKTWTQTYNSQGQVLTVTNPTNGVTTYAYNDDGTLASSTDSEIGTTNYSYDTYKRPNQTTFPDNTSIQTTYNLNDQLVSITDENNNTYSYTYDANGNLTKVTDPAGNETQYFYDLMDRVNQATNRLGKLSSFTYDTMARLASATDPNSIQTSYGYDSRGWLNQTTLGGESWQRSYDAEGIVASRTTPLSNTTTYQSDRLGYFTAITDPLNQTTTFTRDTMTRISGMTDRLNRTTTYSYDSRGMLSSVTVPGIGSTTYSRNDLGQLSRMMDLNGENWAFSYTNMGRLQSATDPLGQSAQYSYDTLGRRAQSTYADSATLTSTYDDTGNVTRMQYSDGTDLQFAYDSLNRLLTANNLTLVRDDEGRVIGTSSQETSFGATYDDGGRLKSTTYANGTFTVTYTYDGTTGLLSRVSDDLTNTQIDFTYDSDRRLTGMTRSNGVNSTLTWDNAGRLTRLQEGSIIDIQYTLDAAGQVTQANMTVPLDPASLISETTDSFTFDAASQVSTTGYTYDSRGRLTASPGGRTFTWDGASRLTGIESVNLTYNGLDDLISRTESGSTVRYHHNFAIGLTPIVAEQDGSSSQFVRYYVWTPEGSLLYMIDAADNNKVYFYHFDRIGSSLALTGSNGTVTDSYAYTPYGKLLQHNGSNDQLFTFVGKWGVRQESTASALYHMRARYYDASSARFINREPIWPLIAEPRQVNPYQYALNTPLMFTDITGEVADAVHTDSDIEKTLFYTLARSTPSQSTTTQTVMGQKQTVNKPPADELIQSNDKKFVKEVYVKYKYAKLRKHPRMPRGAVKVSRGEKLKVLQKKKKWYKVKYEGKRLWVYEGKVSDKPVDTRIRIYEYDPRKTEKLAAGSAARG